MSYVTPSCSVFVRNFAAGYLDTPEADVVSPGATPDAKNAVFAKVGTDPLRVTMRKRYGHRLVTPGAVSAGGTPIDGLFEYRRAGAPPVLLAVSGGSLYRYNEADACTFIFGPGFQAGRQARGLNIKNQALIMDGVFMARVLPLGAALQALPVGLVAPTGAPGLTPAAGPGVTGTYEGFAVYYDSVTDHESSPSPTSPALAFANEARLWTKPAGSPPAHVTHWRVYARRVDISEVNFFRAGTFTIASGTGTEATSDAARVNIGPPPHTNDPPPGAFQFADVFRGYCIGVLPNGTDLYFSLQSDFESWNPSDVLRVNFGRQEIRSVKAVGENCLVQTPTMSFRLEGDRMPFRIVNLHTAFGNVSQDATTEVDAWYYAWDEAKGPYRVSRDFGTWEPLADNRVERIIQQVNREAIGSILCTHDQTRHLVLWTFALGTASRRRTILGYDYSLNTWTSPLVGLEYGAWTPHTTPNGVLGLYVGDLWGRLFELFSGTRDGVPAGTTTATVTSATPTTVTAAAAQWFTGGIGLTGLLAAVRSPAGSWQWRRIASNTATTLTLDTVSGASWITVPSAGWTVVVGGIEWYWTTPWLDFGRPDRMKRGSYLTLQAATAGPGVQIEAVAKFNNEAGASLTYTFATSGSAGVWGKAIWGKSLWAAAPRQIRKLRIGRTFLSAQFRFQNFLPDEAIDVQAYGVEGDWLPRRRVR